ncbi:MAG: SpoIID/LytB domain-containing protein [Actinomycetota bacterium]|nr:SpoIID/LytB domain-containing protein [Actinomycetota bacterium]
MVPTLAALAPAPPAAAEEDPPTVVEVVRFQPVDAATTMSVSGRPYRGVVEVRRHGAGLAVINELPLEDYLRGIVEVPAEWPPAAQQAQAIAARTYALNQKAAPSEGPWRAAGADICPTDACQVYEGVAGEQRASASNWTDAVAATSGQVLLADDQPILAMYSSSNGGRSVRGPAPYLRSVADRDDARSPLSRWTRQAPLAALAPLLGVKAPATLVAVRRTGDAVVLSEQVPGVPDKPVTERSLPVADFVDRVGDPMGSFPSFRFTLRSEGGTAVADGQGFGHGIGMSQYGAYGKALRGLEAGDILAAYYGGVRPVALPPERLPAMRVAVALDQRSVRISSPALFSVVDGAGSPVGGIGRGEWTMTAAAGGVRVTPPDGHDAPLTIDRPVVEAAPAGGGGPAVRFDVSAPAMVSAHLSTPGRSPGVVPARLADAGPVTLELPPVDPGESYQLVIQADGGPGRQTSVPLRMDVADDTAATVVLTPEAATPRSGWLVAAALALAGALVNLRVWRLARTAGGS